jgi:hypothetical protein
MRLDSFRHFLRMRIKGDEITIFPIGLDSVPRRHEWNINLKWKANEPKEPAYVPDKELSPHLIEQPINVRA